MLRWLGTNNLERDRPGVIVDKLLQLRSLILAINRDLTVILGTIIPRGDKLEERAKETNKLLIGRCREEDIPVLKA